MRTIHLPSSGIHLDPTPWGCLYAGPRDWTRVAVVLGDAANHYTNGHKIDSPLYMWPDVWAGD